jgi:hypothetical protein
MSSNACSAPGFRTFPATVLALQARFFETLGREVHKLTDEDYTPLSFFREVWGKYVETGLLTKKY